MESHENVITWKLQHIKGNSRLVFDKSMFTVRQKYLDGITAFPCNEKALINTLEVIRLRTMIPLLLD